MQFKGQNNNMPKDLNCNIGQHLKFKEDLVIKHQTINWPKRRYSVLMGHVLMNFVIHHCPIVGKGDITFLGTPKVIFVFPKKQKLITFIYHLKSVSCMCFVKILSEGYASENINVTLNL